MENEKFLKDKEIESYFLEKYGIHFRKSFYRKSYSEITDDEFSLFDDTLDKFQRTFQISIKEKAQNDNLEVAYTNIAGGRRRYIASYRLDRVITLHSFTRDYEWTFYKSKKQYQEAIFVHELTHWIANSLVSKNNSFSDKERAFLNEINSIVQKLNVDKILNSFQKKEVFTEVLTAYYWLINYKIDGKEKTNIDPSFVINSTDYLCSIEELITQFKNNFICYLGNIENRFEHEKRKKAEAETKKERLQKWKADSEFNRPIENEFYQKYGVRLQKQFIFKKSIQKITKDEIDFFEDVLNKFQNTFLPIKKQASKVRLTILYKDNRNRTTKGKYGNNHIVLYGFLKEYTGKYKYHNEKVLIHELGHWLDFTLSNQQKPFSHLKGTIFNQIAEVTQVSDNSYKAKLEERFADSIAAYYWCVNYPNEKGIKNKTCGLSENTL